VDPVPPDPSAPTTEIGHAGTGIIPWSGFVDDNERVAELRWPASVAMYDRMKTDAQIAGTWKGMTLPIRRYRWSIDPNGADAAVVEDVARQVGLPIKGQEPKPEGRTRNRFSFDAHLRHALLGMRYGHMFFEIVGAIEPDDTGALVWRLRKLAPRMPATLSQIKVARDGGLISIVQYGASLVGAPGGTGLVAAAVAPEIPVTSLVAYVWDQEGGNWLGQSVLRDCYKNWLIKDRLLRVDAVKHERNGMGVPVLEALPGTNPSKAQMVAAADLAQRWRAGEMAGGATPPGFRLRLAGVEGSIPDTIASINYQDQQMARSMLEMFLDLGTTKTGSRALGDTFVSFFAQAQEAVANWIVDTFTAHVIEDIVDWNYGEDVAAPRLMWETDTDQGMSLIDLANLVKDGVLTVDNDLEAFLRQRYNLPDADPTTTRKPPTPTPPPAPVAPALPPPPPEVAAGRRSGGRGRWVAAGASLPDRPLRRLPYPHEVAAATDYAAIEATHTDAVAELTKAWSEIQGTQIEELTSAIEAAVNADDLAALATLTATPAGADILTTTLAEVAHASAAAAVSEAAAQGATVAVPALKSVLGGLAARSDAIEGLMAKSISEAAGRKALSLAGGVLSGSDVASAVADYLNGLTDSFVSQQMGGAVTAAQNEGRNEVIRDAPSSTIYASELLDNNTCGPCTTIDGTEYQTMDDASADYPTGGYMDCEGGINCRGTLVAVYDEAAPSEDG
jgi:hypothetical protein